MIGLYEPMEKEKPSDGFVFFRWLYAGMVGA
jgi:hypothetical protein